ncbi:uncharacterized protein KY384_007215 [Bacidia gigantensis]|uniref:uncharacterized protein n=1 Tax=Bacidia gigantensis TaxID=2732470 RepID=UPI001D0488E9|nr:uncharacterized protein KY384_007215 [Bacidia gigantensis]KAG8528298.1 hypothetical protein KY384_007215 [Bacidia gigantensis]
MTTWWSNERISATINQNYIEKELGSKKYQETLHQVLAFGDGLTDDTYVDWILERSQRFFLILNDIGVPEKIFEDALWELNLFGTTSETLDKKFYRHQFYFLVQDLEPGGHVDYGTWDAIPVESTIKKPHIAAATQSSERVTVHDHLYTRKRIPTSGQNGIDRIRFIMHLKNIAALQHQHLVTVWATYSQNDFNYVLLSPSCDVTLRHILEDKDTARPFKGLEKHERRQLLLSWIHCLTSGLAYLHSRGFMHKAIRPSTISIDHNNVIHLNDYNALRVLDVDESPNPYSGEIYDYAPPENWQRKPTLHETAPLKTTLQGGGRTTRRIPKAQSNHSESRRPSITGQDNPLDRTHSRSQNSSSGSSTSLRPRNALITTFAPPETTPTSLPNKYFPADIFSLTGVILTVLSHILGHSPKAFSSYRSRPNRSAGRGNAPPDASFHKNLKQVDKWIDMLAKEAGQKEKKDQKLWGAIFEMINLCKRGLAKEPDKRVEADELERKMYGWVDWGIGRRNKCDCTEPDRDSGELEKPNPIITAQRDSVLSWSKISERISEGLDDTLNNSVQGSIRPRRSLTQSLSLDRAPELRRSRHTRPNSEMSGRLSSVTDTENEPVSPPSRRQSEIIRSAIKQAIAQTAPTQPKVALNGQGPTVVHHGRSAYRLKPKKAHTTPLTNHRSYHRPFPRPIQEEPDPDEADEESITETDPSRNGSIQTSRNGSIQSQPLEIDTEESAYTLRPKPRSKSHPVPTSPAAIARTFPKPPPRPPAKDARQLPGSLTTKPRYLNGNHHQVVNGIPVNTLLQGQRGEDETLMARDSFLSVGMQSEVWGLGNALEDGGANTPMSEKPLGAISPMDMNRDLNWPLPLGTLTFEGGRAIA